VEKARLELAAKVDKLTTSEFIRQASLDAAEAVLAEQTTLRLSPKQWQAFRERLDQSARVPDGLKDLFSRPRPYGF
jgi:uncharacterized protein (DUF1778 family)